jgi:hypothetical protein
MEVHKADLIEGVAKGMAVLESFDTERQRLRATSRRCMGPKGTGAVPWGGIYLLYK